MLIWRWKGKRICVLIMAPLLTSFYLIRKTRVDQGKPVTIAKVLQIGIRFLPNTKLMLMVSNKGLQISPI
jgi:hypothetical protein